MAQDGQVGPLGKVNPPTTTSPGNTQEFGSGQTPAQPAQPAIAPSQVDVLLKIMLQREERLARKEAAEETAKAAKNAQREKNAQHHGEKELLKQARCSHLKGGKNRRGGVKDYAVYHFTFITAEQRIRCFLCGMNWRPKDTVEFLYRNGKKIANHTKTGWAEASAMLASSTNTPSSSEVPLQAAPQASAVDSF